MKRLHVEILIDIYEFLSLGSQCNKSVGLGMFSCRKTFQGKQ